MFSPTSVNDLFERFPIVEYQIQQVTEKKLQVVVQPQNGGCKKFCVNGH